MVETTTIPTYFWWKRLHSLAGFGIVIFIIFHLITNSQAAVWIGDDGRNYIQSVNSIHDLPYILILEIVLIGFPLVLHAVLGVRYLLTSELNSYGYTGTTPYLPEYERNHAFTWQRITSWILLFCVTFHVVHMRFVEQPQQIGQGLNPKYLVRLDSDEGLAKLSKRLNVDLYRADAIPPKLALEYMRKPLGSGQVMALTPDFGTAELLMVRDAFKSPLMIFIYTILVLAACFHAFNGLWTFLITWGVTLTTYSQRWMLYVTTFLMGTVTFLGLVAIYGTYWFNLRQ